jgi:hypothetical protein
MEKNKIKLRIRTFNRKKSSTRVIVILQMIQIHEKTIIFTLMISIFFLQERSLSQRHHRDTSYDLLAVSPTIHENPYQTCWQHEGGLLGLSVELDRLQGKQR